MIAQTQKDANILCIHENFKSLGLISYIWLFGDNKELQFFY